MIAKRTTRSSRHLTKGLASSKSGVDESDPVFVVGPIGMRGQPTLEEWYALRKAMFDELRRFPVPQNLIDTVHDFKPHAPVTWLNDKGTAAGPEDVLVEPVIAETPAKSPSDMDQFLADAKTEFDELTKFLLFGSPDIFFELCVRVLFSFRTMRPE